MWHFSIWERSGAAFATVISQTVSVLISFVIIGRIELPFTFEKKDIRFDGVACTISTASTSMMTDLLIGKNIEEAKEIIHEYMNMTDGKPYDEDMLEEAVALKNVYRQANRIKCATIGWKAISQMIAESEGQ